MLSGLPLFVFVESKSLIQPVEAWLEQELASSLATCIGERKVETLPDDSGKRQTALLAGLLWLASHSNNQLPFKVRARLNS